MLQLFSILFALIAGHSCRRLPLSQRALNNFLHAAIALILFMMGYDFGSNATHLSAEIFRLLTLVITFTLMLFIFNMLSCYFVDYYQSNRKNKNSNNEKMPLTTQPHYLSYILMSAKYLFYVLAGIAIGYFLKWNIQINFLDAIVSVVLFIIMFIIGHQLKQEGVSLKSILSNKKGFVIAIIVMGSSFLAAAVCAALLNINIKVALMLSSGFGWYTLSGILNGQLINHAAGTAAFLIDFLREIIAIVFIPTIGKRLPVSIIGYCGATALDFTLPIIKENLGNDKMPMAITSGMTLTVLVPILIPLIAAL